MALNRYELQKLKKLLDQASRPLNIFSLGYPDIIIDRRALCDIWDNNNLEQLPLDSREKDIQAWHGYSGEVPNSVALFEYLGHHLTVVDKLAHRGIETLIDLNETLPISFYQTADLIIDTGTLEHCFNVGQAFRNMCELLAVDGMVMTMAPYSKLDHGYYNFCPLMYKDGFRQNGFEIIDLEAIDRKYRPVEIPDATKQGMPPGTVLFCSARKVRNQPWQWPIQGKYLQ